MKKLVFILTMLTMVVACTKDPYETGDSQLSYMRADMVDMKVEGKMVKSIITDDGVSLPFVASLHVSDEMARPDTTYRALIYYNKVDDKPIEIITSQLVKVFNPFDSHTLSTDKTDPVILSSIWQAANGKYLNLSIGLKTGNTEGDSKQQVDVCLDSMTVADDGTRHCYLSLRHAQNDIPQFYTQTRYLSIDLGSCSEGNVLHVRASTYNGIVERTFVKR